MSIGGRTGALTDPAVQYPRQLNPEEYYAQGLPAGWRAIEYAYKSGSNLGKTYVRFSSATKNDLLCTVKKAIGVDAVSRGLSEAESQKLVVKFEALQQARKEALKKERDEAGFLEGSQREEAIQAFRSAYGQLDGATVAKLPGWRSESIWRESCQQLAVVYINQEGRRFGVVKDVECMFGVQVLKGKKIAAIEEARKQVQVNEYGRAVNSARQSVDTHRTAEDSENLKLSKKRKLNPRRYPQLMRWAVEGTFSDDSGLVLLPLPPISSASAAEAGELPSDTPSWAANVGVPVDVAEELAREASEVRTLLHGRGFGEATELVVLRGIAAEHPLSAVLQGLFYMMVPEFNGRPCFQRVFKDSKGRLSCQALYIFWSDQYKKWKIGGLDDDEAGFAFSEITCSRPWVARTPQPIWMVDKGS